jgi:flagellar motor switch protein FliG
VAIAIQLSRMPAQVAAAQLRRIPPQITGNVSKYLGETVTVRGQYKQEISEVGFTITEEDIFGDDNFWY